MRALDRACQASSSTSELDAACTSLRALVSGLQLPPALLRDLASRFGPSDSLAVRSSANVEDLAGMSAAGLYDSVVGVKASDEKALNAAVTDVWASLYSRRAVLSRRAAGVAQADAAMAVLVQQLVVPEYSFVAHTANPYDPSKDCMVVEAAPGLGETLASGTQGSPYRLEIPKSAGGGSLSTTSFANFSSALGLDRSGKLVSVPVDYSQQPLTASVDARKALAAALREVLLPLEQHYGGPQDVEGGWLNGEVYVFQTRPQPM